MDHPIRYRIKIKRYFLLAMLWICIGLNADLCPRTQSRDLMIKNSNSKILLVEKNSYFLYHKFLYSNPKASVKNFKLRYRRNIQLSKANIQHIRPKSMLIQIHNTVYKCFSSVQFSFRQCCGSGSTGSTCFWASRIRIH